MGQAGEGILLVDVGTKRVREASAAYRGMLGYAPEEISPLALCDLVPSSRGPWTVLCLGRVREGETCVSAERRHRRKDGPLVATSRRG